MDFGEKVEINISDEIDFDFHKENLMNQLNNPDFEIDKNFLKILIKDIDDCVEEMELDVSSEGVKSQIIEIREEFVDIIKESLERYWDIEFDLADSNSTEKIISEFYKLYINRKQVLLNSLTQYLKSSGNRNEIIRKMELNPSADDVSTISYKKVFRRNDATILANISGVIEFILDEGMNEIQDILKKSNKYEAKKYLDKILKYIDYVDDPDSIYRKYREEAMDVATRSELSVALTHNLANIFDRKGE